MSYQSIQILGRVGQSAELRYTATGTAVASFSLASNETWTSNGERQTRVTWHRCTLWGKVAESLAEHITKGKELFVSGTVTARAYTAKNGEAAASLEVKVDQVRFVGSKSDNQGSSYADPTDNVSVDEAADLPF